MKMLVSALVAAAALVAVSTPASAAITVTTYQGTIDNGQDIIGFIGPAGTDLTGLSYTAKITLDTSVNRFQPEPWSDTVVGPGYPEATSSDNPFISIEMNVDGTLFTVPLFDTDYAFVDTTGIVHESGIFAAQPWYFSASGGGIPNNLDTPFNVVPDFGTANLVFHDANGAETFWLQGNVSRVTMTTGGIPEPATWALMIGGFGLAGTALRRRRKAVIA